MANEKYAEKPILVHRKISRDVCRAPTKSIGCFLCIWDVPYDSHAHNKKNHVQFDKHEGLLAVSKNNANNWAKLILLLRNPAAQQATKVGHKSKKNRERSPNVTAGARNARQTPCRGCETVQDTPRGYFKGGGAAARQVKVERYAESCFHHHPTLPVNFKCVTPPELNSDSTIIK